MVQSSPVQLNENTYCYLPQNSGSVPETTTKIAVEQTTMAESVLQDKVAKLKQELTVTPKSTKSKKSVQLMLYDKYIKRNQPFSLCETMKLYKN